MVGTVLVWLTAAALAFAVGLAIGRLFTAASHKPPPKPVSPQLKQFQAQLAELVGRAEQLAAATDTRAQAEIQELADDLRSIATGLVTGVAAKLNSRPSYASPKPANVAAAEAKTAPPPALRDQRGADRRPFESEQLIAQYNGRRIPKAWAFRLHKCRDVSTRGMSFFSDQRMASEFVIVRLGNATQSKFVAGKVVRTTRARLPDGDGYCIACRFTEILDHHRVSDSLQIELNSFLERENGLDHAPLCKTVSYKK